MSKVLGWFHLIIGFEKIFFPALLMWMGNLVRKCCSQQLNMSRMASDVPKKGMPSMKCFNKGETRNSSMHVSGNAD